MNVGINRILIILRKYALSAIGAPGNEYGNWVRDRVGARVRHMVRVRVTHMVRARIWYRDREYDEDLGLGMNRRALGPVASGLGRLSVFIPSSFDGLYSTVCTKTGIGFVTNIFVYSL